jgi:1-acyl-sn-glycerol-3-phosphate acyltransferase
VTEQIGVTPDRIVLAHPRAIPKTSSGKIRRSATRDALQSGKLEEKTAGIARQWLRLASLAFGGLLLHWSKRLAQMFYTAYVMSIILATGVVTLLLLIIVPNGRTVDRVIGRWIRLILTCGGCSIRVIGRDQVPTHQPVVFVANHASYLDPPLMMNVLPGGARFAAKGRLTEYPILGLAIRKGGHIPIDKSNQTQRVEGASDIRHPLHKGESLFIFPEGTFELAPRLLPFRLGAFQAAVEANCAIVPVAIRGTRHIFPARTLLLKPGPITVTFGQPLPVNGSDWKEIVRLRDEARSFISKHCGES